MTFPNAALPGGSTIVVSGVSGLIGAVVARDLINYGYKVRATTRAAKNIAPLVERFDEELGPGKLEIVEVPKHEVEGAYDQALQGAAGFIHIATDTSFGINAKEAVEGNEKATLAALEACARTPSIKRVVLTSSRIAVFHPFHDDVHKISGSDTWNDEMYAQAWTMKDDDPSKGIYVYAASKIAGETAAWNFVKTTKPKFGFNTVLPDYVIGEVLNPGPVWGSTGGIVQKVFKYADASAILPFANPASWYVDVKDVSRLHIGALLDKETTNERIWAAAGSFSAKAILDIFRKHYPGRRAAEDPDIATASITIEQPVSFALLRKQGRAGYSSLEDCILDTVRPIA